MEQAGIDDTPDNFFRHGAIVVLKHAAEQFGHRPYDDDGGSLDQYHPTTVEPGDYYRSSGIMPSFAMMGDRLRAFLRRHDEMLDNQHRFDRKAVQTQLITLISKRYPKRDVDRIVDRIRRMTDLQVLDYFRRLTWDGYRGRS